MQLQQLLHFKHSKHLVIIGAHIPILAACIITLKLTVYCKTRGYSVVSYWCPAVTEIRQTHLKTQNYCHPVKTIQTSHMETTEEKTVDIEEKAVDKAIDKMTCFEAREFCLCKSWKVWSLFTAWCCCTWAVVPDHFAQHLKIWTNLQYPHTGCGTPCRKTCFQEASLRAFTVQPTLPGRTEMIRCTYNSAAGFTDAYLVSLTHLQRCSCTCCTCTIW